MKKPLQTLQGFLIEIANADPRSVAKRFFLLGNIFSVLRLVSVDFDVPFPLVREIIFMEDGFDRTLWNTGFAVDALIWIDVEHLFAFVEAFNGANYNAIGVSATVTRFGYDVSHSLTPGFD